VDLKDHGRVDKGFINALADDVKELVSLIPAGARSLFTGHSLGGALATLAAALHSPDYLYTYGSPRVGDHAFATSIDVVKHERYVDCCDWVTMVPPVFMKYEHAGDLHYINRHGMVMTSLSNEEIKEDRHKATKEYLNTCPPAGRIGIRSGCADWRTMLLSTTSPR
jgi:predicted lipase